MKTYPRHALTEAPNPPQKRWQSVKLGVDARDDYEDENLYEVSGGRG